MSGETGELMQEERETLMQEEIQEVPTISIMPISIPPSADAAEVFDFTVPESAMDTKTKALYFALRRKAKMVSTAVFDEADRERFEYLNPNGKILTRSEVQARLGKTIEEAFIPPEACCGR